MNSIALHQAQLRLAKARDAIRRAERARTYSDFSDAWSDFLIAHAGVYSKLEKGSKGNGLSSAWFGRKKRIRRTDELLCYLHHARNADEHGIQPTIESNSTVTIGGNGYIRELRVASEPDGTLHARGRWDSGVSVQSTWKASLVNVIDDRFGDSYSPPAAHLGKAIKELAPISLAKMALAYLESLLAEAAEFIERD